MTTAPPAPRTAAGLPHPRAVDLPTAVPLDPDADLTGLDRAKILAAPGDPADWPAWRAALHRWRDGARTRHPYRTAHYDAPAAVWAAHAVSVGVAWLWDETLYDRAAGRFTPDGYLDAAERDFGGHDAVVLWNGYPFLGLDGRDQFACYAAVPELPDVVRRFHDRGVRVMIPYNPWDTGTGRPDPAGHAAPLAALVAALDADGVFLDTLRGGGDALLTAVLAARPGTVFETESAVPTDRIGVHLTSWAQWWADGDVPGVPRARWFEPRHMTHATRRWHTDHRDELHSAWLSGGGILVWENVFGAPVRWNARDRALLRAVLPARRHFTDHFAHGDWQPLLGSADPALPAARFRHDGITLHPVANRTGAPWTGPLLGVPADPALEYYDAVAGVRLDERLTGHLPRDGAACVVALPPGRAREPRFRALLHTARTTAARWSDDATPPAVTLRRTPVPHAPRPQPPPGFTALPAGPLPLTTVHQVREPGLPGSAPYADAWKPLPPLLHQDVTARHTALLTPCAVAVRPTTNDEFAAFLTATGHAPHRPEGFLAHWSAGRPAPGTGDDPVVCVDLDDARAYAAWRGLRLPTPDEWQAAAPHFAPGGPRVWNWTESEATDGRTRTAVLKGGADHRTGGSEWYAPGGPRPPGYLLPLPLPAAGSDRFTTVGFRCAADLPAAPPSPHHRTEREDTRP